ncbi:electron transport complex subunit RsxC [Psychromonas sp. psych-6C06]|uniref:electron transport complex subunit RsxC n=1 Tax=Psychromonas sp. psych-6C06 TaxID=2058089 RepID=UPI000C32FFED|nr:electron transport complex subunit RsxC [Psychromonas sp. psych-6C06]PKF63405.1 electron transport complex subunit RsxC [Psychromonas sp. psych-6C06]
MTEKFNLLSDEQLDAISSGKLWNFHGGIHPEENKLQSSQYAIRDAGIPATLVIPVEQKGHTPELLVKVGDAVLKGQPLTKVYSAMVVQHASSSGTVIAIEKRCDLHPSGLGILSVVIQTDGLDRAVEYIKPEPYEKVAPALLVDAIQQAGIVGLGGAGFPSHLKLVQHEKIKLLLINAAECEPYITADDRLMQEQAYEIIEGINILNHILQPQLTIIAIEDNKKEAIKCLNEALKASKNNSHISLRVIPTIYPSGSEKQLIEIITGQQTPIGKHPSELGIVMQNVGTVFAIKQAIIDAKPLTSRIVTLTGDSLQKRGNVSVRIGTPIQYLLDRYWVDSIAVKQLIIGGPMMGFTINDTSAPVTKTCNCILAPTAKEFPEAPAEMPCIRCSECADACPATLLPQQLLWYSKSQDHDKLKQYNLNACIECGACAFVCPSHIPLVEYYRVAKAEIKVAEHEAKKAEIARIRHENREARLAQAKLDRQAKHKEAAEKRKAQMKEKNGGEDLIAAALARAKAKKQSTPDTLSSEQQTEISKPVQKNDAVAAAIARAKAKKAKQVESNAKTVETNLENNVEKNTTADPKKAAVAAAIARAKAKKAKQVESNADNSEEKPDSIPSTDSKKAAVAAAIARAKAKKAKQSENSLVNNEEEATPVPSSPEQSVDPKKAAVAAAIARAKAKKAKQVAENVENTESSSPSDSNIDPKKVAVAAAIARAKAKKAQQAAEIAEEAEAIGDIDITSASDSVQVDSKLEAPQSASNANQLMDPIAIEPDNSAVIAERKKRKEQARLAKQQKKQAQLASDAVGDDVAPPSEEDVKKAKIAAAVARAKAKKANSDSNNEGQQ